MYRRILLGQDQGSPVTNDKVTRKRSKENEMPHEKAQNRILRALAITIRGCPEPLVESTLSASEFKTGFSG